MKTDEEIQKYKDTFDLAPVFAFIARHDDVYKRSLAELMLRDPERDSKFVRRLVFIDSEQLAGESGHLTMYDIQAILCRMPATLRALSELQAVDFSHAEEVVVPIFDEEGNWKRAEYVATADFPRANDHPSRILIGRYDSKTIYVTDLPQGITMVHRNRTFYQLHVLLHEFFHSIESRRGDPTAWGRVKLMFEGKEFGLQNWWEEWEDLFLQKKVRFPSRYAASYADWLTSEVRQNEPEKFNRALAEQMCESFVGYMFGIVPNDQDNASFWLHSRAAALLMHKLAYALLVEL